MEFPGRVTELLHEGGAGDRNALDRALPLVYDELRRLAHGRLRREADGHTLNTTALVHEAYIRLGKEVHGQVRDRGHFFALAATAMRRILVDYARRHHAQKRGGSARRVPLENVEQLAAEDRAAMLLALDDALDRRTSSSVASLVD
jgi:RNA polymerase sigma-70 factor (ECF subfamily)